MRLKQQLMVQVPLGIRNHAFTYGEERVRQLEYILIILKEISNTLIQISLMLRANRGLEREDELLGPEHPADSPR